MTTPSLDVVLTEYMQRCIDATEPPRVYFEPMRVDIPNPMVREELGSLAANALRLAREGLRKNLWQVGLRLEDGAVTFYPFKAAEDDGRTCFVAVLVWTERKEPA